MIKKTKIAASLGFGRLTITSVIKMTANTTYF
jgi:hypothetical protein